MDDVIEMLIKYVLEEKNKIIGINTDTEKAAM